jgi:glutamine synthetase
MQDKPTAEQALAEITAADKPKVKLAITDIDGVLRGKYLHRDKFLGAARDGFGFCNVVFGWDAADVCYDDAAYTGWHSGYPDALARVDLCTYRRVPWDDNVPFFLADFEDASGNALPVCPRRLLRSVVERANSRGLNPVCAFEFEFFNFKETPQSLQAKRYTEPEPITPGMFGYSVLRTAQNQPFFAAMMDELLAFRVPLEGLHTETGPGVLEAAILYAGAVEAADRAVLFKSSVKEIGRRYGIMPSFMAKWSDKLPGCSGHTHQSLWNDAGDNVFHDEKDPLKMSATFRQYLAGQMRLMPEILPFFAPTVNSYKRLVEGAWAPTRVNWGVDNRTTALRVIQGSPKSTRLETRVVGSDVNPYLAAAACIASGLYGIEHKLELPSGPVSGSGYRDEAALKLPSNLGEATERLAESTIAREIFGAAFVDHFVTTRRWEWRQYQAAVTNWETERYFEII